MSAFARPLLEWGANQSCMCQNVQFVYKTPVQIQILKNANTLVRLTHKFNGVGGDDIIDRKKDLFCKSR